jgi:hypothetical protein
VLCAKKLSWKCPLRTCPIFDICHAIVLSRDMSRGHTHVAALSGHQKSMMSCPDRTFQNMLLKVFKTLNNSLITYNTFKAIHLINLTIYFHM